MVVYKSLLIVAISGGLITRDQLIHKAIVVHKFLRICPHPPPKLFNVIFINILCHYLFVHYFQISLG
jgi:hypothetical protein